MELKFGFAVNQSNVFEPKHFGDADKFLIYKWHGDALKFLNEENNPFKNFDENQAHGSFEKGKAIIGFLKKLDVQILISKQFGKNIQLINRHFIPVFVPAVTLDEAIEVLAMQIKELEGELDERPALFNRFTIKDGVLQSTGSKRS